MEACSQNLGDLAYPRNFDELQFFEATANPLSGPILLGIFLPLELSSDITCEEQKCEDYLLQANGDKFQYEDWMGSMFNRIKGQEHLSLIHI